MMKAFEATLLFLATLQSAGAVGYLRSNVNSGSEGEIGSVKGSSGHAMQPRSLQASSEAAFCATFSDTSIAYHLIIRASGDVVATNSGGTAPTDATLDSSGTQDDWTLVPTADATLYTIENSAGSKLSIAGDSMASGAAVILGGASSSDAWCFRDFYGDGYYQIVNANSGISLTIGSTSVTQSPITGDYDQKFRLTPVSLGDGPLCSTFADNYIGTLSPLHSGKLLSIPAANTGTAGANVVQDSFDVTSPGSYQWNFQWLGNGYYHLINVASGLAMNIRGATTDDGASIIQWEAEADQSNDNWCFLDEDFDNFYEIVSEFSGDRIDITAARTVDGTEALQWPQNGALNQQYEILPAAQLSCGTLPAAGLSYHIVARHSGKALRPESSDRGAPVEQMTIDYGSTGDDWTFTAVGTSYTFLNVASGFAMNVAGNNNNDGAPVVQWDADASQQNDDFCLNDPDGDLWYNLIALHSLDYVDISGNSQSDGAGAVQWFSNGGLNQQFKVIPALSNCATLPAGVSYHIVARHSDKALSATGAGGSVVQMTTDSSGTQDDWALASPTNGFYKIINQASGLALQVAGESLASGGDIVQAAQSQGGNDLFCFQDAGDGYYTISAQHSGLSIDIATQSTADGANAGQAIPTGGTNQQFQLVPTVTPLCPQLSVLRANPSCDNGNLQCSYAYSTLGATEFCNNEELCLCDGSMFACTVTPNCVPIPTCPARDVITSNPSCPISNFRCVYTSSETVDDEVCTTEEHCTCGDNNQYSCAVQDVSCVPRDVCPDTSAMLNPTCSSEGSACTFTSTTTSGGQQCTTVETCTCSAGAYSCESTEACEAAPTCPSIQEIQANPSCPANADGLGCTFTIGNPVGGEFCTTVTTCTCDGSAFGCTDDVTCVAIPDCPANAAAASTCAIPGQSCSFSDVAQQDGQTCTTNSTCLCVGIDGGGGNFDCGTPVVECADNPTCPSFMDIGDGMTCAASGLSCSISYSQNTDTEVCQVTESCTCSDSLSFDCTVTQTCMPAPTCPSRTDLLANPTCSFDGLGCNYMYEEDDGTQTCEFTQRCDCDGTTFTCAAAVQVACTPNPPDLMCPTYDQFVVDMVNCPGPGLGCTYTETRTNPDCVTVFDCACGDNSEFTCQTTQTCS